MKKRPLCIAAIIYVIGIIMGLYLKISIALLMILILGTITFFMIYIKKDEKVRKIKFLKITLVIISILVFAIIYIQYIDNTYEEMYKEISNLEEIEIIATVTSSVKEKEYLLQYEIKMLELNGNKKYQGKKLVLNVKKKNNEEIKQLEYGDFIKVLGEFKVPNEARNYGGFDYKQYLKTKKIYGTINASEIEVIDKGVSTILGKVVYQVQNSIKNKIREVLPKETEELCIGILIGDRGNLEEQIEEDFKNSSLTHMLAVSGSHISYIILGVSFAIQKIGKKISKIATIFFLLFFMSLADFTASVVRASIMGILILLADLFYRKSDLFNNLAISTIMILVINPYTIIDIGFQLSYAGTIGIVLLDQRIQKKIDEKVKTKNKIVKSIIDSIIVTLSANILIIPIMAYQFNTISFNFWISNLLAAPLMGASVILGFLTYFVSLLSITIAKIFAIPLNLILLLFLKIAEMCSKLPFSSVLVKTPYIASIIIYYSILFLILYRKSLKETIGEDKIKKGKRKIRKLILKVNKLWGKQRVVFYIIISISIVILIFTNIFISNNKILQIYFIDVGQGDSTLIITPKNKKILIDGGGSEFSSFNIGERTLLPYLLDRRITKLDYIMISHFDTDHVGGILSILEKIKVKNVILSKQGEASENYKRFKKIVRKNKINIIMVKQGDRIQIEKHIFFDIFFPEDEQIQENILNNNSIVAKLCYRDISVLFTGDVEEITERRLIQIGGERLKSTILKVAHHGSKSSSIQPILDKIQPKIALIGVRTR